MRFQKILCATDFSSGAAHALVVATQLAKTYQAELVVVHAFEEPTAFGELPAPAEVTETLRAEAIRELATIVGDARAKGVETVSSGFLGGPAAETITKLLESSDFDLLVIGTHGRTGLSRIVLGSVAEKLVRMAPCSVIVARGDSTAARFAHVLCPIDQDTPSRCAMLEAGHLAKSHGARLTLLNVAEVSLLGYTGQRAVHYLATIGRYSEEMLRKAADDLRDSLNITVETRSATGSPGGQILALLDEDRTIDLVVMGTHGRGGLKRMFLGSVAEKLVRHARCPVLVSRPKR